LQRYYEFFPGFFTKRVRREGGWYVWGNIKDTPGAADAGFMFHWGPASADAVRYDNANGFLALHYIEPEFFQQTMGDFSRAPTSEEAIARLRKIAGGDPQEMAKMEKLGYSHGYAPANWVAEHSLRDALKAISHATVLSAYHSADGCTYAWIGQYPWMSESQWGVIFPCNLDPDIPKGKGWFNSRIYLDYALPGMEEQGTHVDGIALDSLGGYGQHSRANYRREHFRYADFPLSFSAIDHRPVQVAAFTTVEWVRSLAREMQSQGKVLMTNCSWGFTPGWLTFAAPYLDIFGAEATQFADPDYIRAIACRKPCTDLPYNPRPEWEMPWHWLHDIYPGHGNNLNAMRRCIGLLRELSAAGWEPITGARVRPNQVRIERYGSREHIYLVLHNPTEKDVQAEVRVDAKTLKLPGFTALLQPAGHPLQAQGNRLTVPLAGRETVVVVLNQEGSPR